MEIAHSIKEVKDFCRDKGRVGFVPTMGFLHQGHLTLIRQSKLENAITICSIFVNPIQFNNPADLEKYPRNIDQDCAMLEKEGCDLVFIPSVEEMYPDAISEKYEFGALESVLEGAHRPGHFQGVAIVVRRLFDIVGCCNAYFGEKDYQQLQIIRKLVEITEQNAIIHACPIIREPDGLAMSSRNVRLTPADRSLAPAIYRIISSAASKKAQFSPNEMTAFMRQQFNNIPEMNPDYIEIASSSNLQAITDWQQDAEPRIFVAIWLGGIRLIDNVPII